MLIVLWHEVPEQDTVVLTDVFSLGQLVQIPKRKESLIIKMAGENLLTRKVVA